ALRNSQADSLSFQAIDKMNAIAAKELAQFRGDKIAIGGKVKLDLMHALALSQFTGASLDLLNIRSFGDQFLPKMASYPGALKLQQRFKPTFTQAREAFLKSRPAWAKSVIDAVRKDRSLAIIAMTKMTREVAKELQDAPGQKLVFQSLTELDFIQAGHLSRTSAKSLHFPKLKKLSKEAREALFRFKGEISINGKVEQTQ
ncbi:MAG: hypothetical protein P1V97_36825, partial [Planctomycetota bacterium]|nr:hypothetical protein [Planctomycetota bacterium]